MLFGEVSCGWGNDGALGDQQFSTCLNRQPHIFFAHEIERGLECLGGMGRLA